jgi:hypothetical protein
LNGLRQLERRMFAIVEAGWSRKERRLAASADIRFENLVGIVKITQDQVKAAEVIAQLCRQLAISDEKSGERARFNRPDRVRVEPFFAERGDVFDAQNFQARARKTIAQQLDGRQREDEIADRAAADDQNAVQVSNA